MVNKKIYIGQTSRTIEIRFREHSTFDERFPTRPLTNSILKHGKENFNIEVIAKCASQIEANEIETFYIRKFDSMNRDKGYNLVEEQNGTRIFTKETLAKMRESRIETYSSFSEEKKADIKKKLSVTFQGFRKNEKTGFFGVYRTKHGTFNIKSKMWKCIKRQTFSSARKAAICYDKLALLFFGKEARLNFPSKIEKWRKQDLNKFFTLLCSPRGVLNKRKRFLHFSAYKNKWVVCFQKGKKKVGSKVFNIKEDAELWRDKNYNRFML